MRGAVRRQEAPAQGPGLEARLAGTLAQLQSVLRKISRDPASSAAVCELTEAGVTLLEVRAAYAAHAAAVSCHEHLIERGRAMERAEQSQRPGPGDGAAGQPPLMRLVPRVP
jgi:hypothetical protein